MFLFWLLLALAIGTMENITDSYKAYKYNSTGGFYARHPAFKPEPWEQEPPEQTHWNAPAKKRIPEALPARTGQAQK